jgi:hypothetical protein
MSALVDGIKFALLPLTKPIWPLTYIPTNFIQRKAL